METKESKESKETKEDGRWAVKLQAAGGSRVCRGPGGVDGTGAGGALLEAGSALAGLPPTALRFKAGFPPRALDLSRPADSLRALGISSGETIIVEETPASSAPSAPPAPSEPSAPSATYGFDPEIGYRGLLLKKPVPSDNSCLFTSVGFTMSGRVDTTVAPLMRKIIAEVVASDTVNYCDAVLGKPNAEYCDWIQRPDSWGGAIELSVLTNLYGLEIDVVNVFNAVVNRFGEDKNYGQRVFLLFDGIHYDPLFSERPTGGIQTIFPVEDLDVLQDAETLAKSAHPYTDLDNFKTKCLVCDAVLIGQKSANQHAIETNHTKFSEF